MKIILILATILITVNSQSPRNPYLDLLREMISKMDIVLQVVKNNSLVLEHVYGYSEERLTSEANDLNSTTYHITGNRTSIKKVLNEARNVLRIGIAGFLHGYYNAAFEKFGRTVVKLIDSTSREMSQHVDSFHVKLDRLEQILEKEPLKQQFLQADMSNGHHKSAQTLKILLIAVIILLLVLIVSVFWLSCYCLRTLEQLNGKELSPYERINSFRKTSGRTEEAYAEIGAEMREVEYAKVNKITPQKSVTDVTCEDTHRKIFVTKSQS